MLLPSSYYTFPSSSAMFSFRSLHSIKARQLFFGRLAALLALVLIVQALWFVESLQKRLSSAASLIRAASSHSDDGLVHHPPPPIRPFLASSPFADYEGDLICPTSNCSEPGTFAPQLQWVDPVTVEDIQAGTFTTSQLHKYIQQSIFTRAQQDPVPFPSAGRGQQLVNWLACPDTLFSASLAGLKPRIPTAYVFTRVAAAGGRLADVELRLAFLARHARTFKRYNEVTELEGHLDGTKAENRQLMWIMIEDGVAINPPTAKFLKDSGIRGSRFPRRPAPCNVH